MTRPLLLRALLAVVVVTMLLGAGGRPAAAQHFPDLPLCADTLAVSYSRNADIPWFQRLAPGPLNPGTFIRYWQVPPQSVQVSAWVPGPDEVRPVTVQVPGFTITETTTGYFYPERWGIRPVSSNSYGVTRLPAQFACKPLRR